MFIPKKIKVGYQSRQDTYTGQLAYIIYYDKSNKIRKEASWNGWRDKEIDPNDYDNVPTEGFVLNKKAGDYQSSWGGRKAYSRIYDPRGFEFEINIDNLLYILEHCRSDPGKALEGKFVYAWDGTELVLLPEGTPEFKESQDFSDLKERRINIKKLQVGQEYYSKQKKEWCLYMGEFFVEIASYSWGRVYFVNQNRYVFKSSSGFYSDDKPSFVAQRDFSGNFEDVMTDLIENSILTDSVDSLVLKEDEAYPNYAEYDGKIVQKIGRWVIVGPYQTSYWGRRNENYVHVIQSATLNRSKIEWIDEPNISVETFNSLPKLSLFIKTKKGMEYQYG